MSATFIDWEGLRSRHDFSLVEVAERLFQEGGPFEISAETMASQTSRSIDEAEYLLTELCPPLRRVSVTSCPNCEYSLSDDDVHSEMCPNCHQEYAEHGGVHLSSTFFYDVARTRDVVWVLALHGMNTRGEWQEEFNWRASNAYSRSVPVAIYKYGLVQPGAIWRPSLRRKMKNLIAKIRKLQGDTEENGFAGRPDVIAHSLGTWLIGHALELDASLRVGRVILTGCILRPDFDWAKLIARGQVEAVLNHYGPNDFWAGIAQYVIPDSGPSGKSGFSYETGITQVRAEGFGHSDFFLPENLAKSFEAVWKPFLAGRSTVTISAATAESPWRPTAWILNATLLPITLLTLYWMIVLMLILSCMVGIYEIYRWL